MKSKYNGRSYAALAARLKKEKEKGKRLQGQINELNSDEMLYELVKNNVAVKNRIIAEYLTSLAGRQNPALISSGQTALTPVNKPKNLAEAKRLADKIIKY